MSYSSGYRVGGDGNIYLESQTYNQVGATGPYYPNVSNAQTSPFTNQQRLPVNDHTLHSQPERQTCHHQQSFGITGPTITNGYFQPCASLSDATLTNDPLCSDFRSDPAPLSSIGGHITHDNPYHHSQPAAAFSNSYHVPTPTTNLPETGVTVEYLAEQDISAPSKKRHKDKATTKKTGRDKIQKKQEKAAAAEERKTKLAHDKARYGDMWGSDNKPKPEVREYQNGLAVWLKDQWVPAVRHKDIRAELIQHDARQPGAPEWHNGMSLDYTSYSPLVSSWTEDPSSITDQEGREVFQMREPPKEYRLKPNHGFLKYNGCWILDHNNRLVKYYPGAPLTLKYQCGGHMLEGLRRVFGMVIEDVMARMDLAKHFPNGLREIRYTRFTQCISNWRNQINLRRQGNNPIVPWHHRRPKEQSKITDTPSSSRQRKTRRRTTGSEKQTGGGNQDSASLSPRANVPTANNDNGTDINTLAHPSGFAQQNIYPPVGFTGPSPGYLGENPMNPSNHYSYIPSVGGGAWPADPQTLAIRTANPTDMELSDPFPNSTPSGPEFQKSLGDDSHMDIGEWLARHDAIPSFQGSYL